MIQQYAAYKKLILALRTHKLKVKRWKKIFHANGNQKRAAVTTYIKLNKL